MMISILKNIPPSILVPGFYCFYTSAFLIRFLFNSVYGYFVISVSLYGYTKHYAPTPPLTGSELIIWLLNLSPEYKVAILSSTVTILGFVVAFHTATANWRGQMKAQLKSQAADEIENFFSIVTNNITIARLHVESLVKTINKIQQGENIEEINFLIGYQQGKANEFMSARDTLSQASVEVHRLISKNNDILSSGWGLPSNINLATESLSEISQKMWVNIPIVNLQEPNYIQSFFNQVNVSECQDFINSCNTNYGKLAGISGGIRGYLTSSIWGFSLSNFINLVSNRESFKKSITGLHNDLNIKS